MPTKEELESLRCSGEGIPCPTCSSPIRVMERWEPFNHPQAGWIRTGLYLCERGHWLTEWVELHSPAARLVETSLRPKGSPPVA
jgi:hypothetical protein